ncbi:chemosensory pili system protein ChpA (sensor histidine kinase/response regulator) [Marinobacter daqiaonensis]|uniref:Chemotaxis protein CheA n=1 Tax=Marinobacter daqiaonensis TaxID=650891 RepID=A0A1I6I8S0_9GAMM|nr:Hpt domain-containing protein [Marinobacter daqiaonensis]SFR63135.1 chemosensory pili system protein ChpA (sensor histidine kinase/response regulator) [Marinobacter daqiaonensis]
MGNNHDNIALDWVRGEIEQTLKQGQQALEAYVDNRDDTARLRFCLNYLHQVHGTLQMVELQGAALLTEEMEKLTQAILGNRVDSPDQAVGVLMEAILRLPRYLEGLRSSADDLPLALLPLLNDLRAARGEGLLSDLSLFRPDMTQARFEPSPKVARLLQDPKILANVGKLGKMFHRSVMATDPDQDNQVHYQNLQKVIQRLVKLCTGTPREELWRAAGGFIETLQHDLHELAPATRTLLQELDHEIDRLTREPKGILHQPVPETLFRNLLYYVAQAHDGSSPYLVDLRQRYRLTEALPAAGEADHGDGPGREAIHSVVVALNEEVARLKDQLDLFVRDQHRQNQDLEELIPGLRQVANTLAVIGLGNPRRIIGEQIDLVEKLIRQSETADDGILLDIAGALLYVEATLSGLDRDRGPGLQRKALADEDDTDVGGPGRQELGDAHTALLRESRNALEQVKSAVVNFIASQWDPREIEHVPSMLASIEGGLKVIPLERPAQILSAARDYIQQVLLERRRIPDWKQLDTLADSVTSIEYYLERLTDGISDNESVLRVAEESLRSLGFPPGEEPTWVEAETSAEIPEGRSSQAPLEAPEQAAKNSDMDLVDDEILEIFVEEAGEVLETIHEWYPQLRQNHDDREALTEVRRAYHTLKGSGRLVGAVSIGELAWSIENLLNRVLDQSLKPTDELFALVDEVNDRLPGLIDEFRTGSADGDVSDLIQRAEAMATTRKTGQEAVPDEAADDHEAWAETSENDDLREPGEAAEEAPAQAIPPESTPEPADDYDDLIDDEIIEIFVEEAGEVLETINEYLPMLLRQYDDRSAMAEVRRAFHTLKGSGRMVGATTVGELAWSVENMLNRVIDGTVLMNDDIASLLREVTDQLPALVADFEHRRTASVDTQALEMRANALANGDISDAREMPAADQEPEAVVEETPEPADGDNDDLVDPVLVDIFESEARTHLATLEAFLEESEGRSSVPYTDHVSRALHTLKGSANTAGIQPIAEIITPLEQFVKQARAENRRADSDVLQLIHQACEFLKSGLDQLHTSPQQPLRGTEAYLERLAMVSAQTLGRRDREDGRESTGSIDSQLVTLFLSDGLDVLLDADRIVNEWTEEPGEIEGIQRLSHELEQLSKGARNAGLTDVSELTDGLSTVYRNALSHPEGPDDWFLETVRSAHDHLINLMDQVAAGLATQPDATLQTELQVLADSLSTVDADSAGTDEDVDYDTLALPDVDVSEETDEITDEVDEELAEIFLEEAQDLIASTADALESWQERPDNTELLRLMQRDLHTLKGGARLADVQAIGNLAHDLETLFEGLSEHRLGMTPELSDLLFRCHDRLAGMVEALANGEPPRPAPDLEADIRRYMDTASGSRPVTDMPGTGEELPDTDGFAEDQIIEDRDESERPEGVAEFDAEPEVPDDFADDQDEPVAPEEVAEDPEQSETPYELGLPDLEDLDQEAATYDLSHLDPELVSIFLEEAYDLINSTGSALHAWSENTTDQTVAAELQRDVHTLKGSARMTGVEPIADLTHVLEDLFERVVEGRLSASQQMLDLLFACHDRLANMVDEVATSRPCAPARDLVARVQAILDGRSPAGPSPEPMPAPAVDESVTTEADEAPELSADEITGMFLEEGLDICESIEESLVQWREEPEQLTGITQLQEELHTLKGGARLADIDAVADLAAAWSDALGPLLEGSGNQPLVLSLSERANAGLRAMLTALEEGDRPAADDGLLRLLREAASHLDEPGEALTPAPEANTDEEPDVEVLEIFLEEAQEILDQLEQLLADWRQEPDSHHFNQEIQRALHTLKGGARLSRQPELGDLAHDFEALLTDLGDKVPDQAAWQKITQYHDGLIASVSRVRSDFEAYLARSSDSPAREAPAPKAEPEARSAPETGTVVPAPAKAPQATRKAIEKRRRESARAAQETIRVSAPLLDDLVNLAGETSITRSRLEQQNSDFSHTLDEMAATIDRLREQLRRMDIETEAQILFRAEQEHGPDYGEDFDPLEMDRYSSIQQLSRALSESSSDLADLRETMADRVRDTDTLLVQQSRINTELQEGLMKTRMIPFASMVPRLRRIVRQISGELGKKVEFDVRNAEGELDRNILERMVAPLEHMLRNALDHGIESPSERARAGKPETGQVNLTLTREGGEVVLRMMDDGAGIPSDIIRRKAIERGLLSENENLSQREILQFILQPGFSTAKEVTQISGRGVGMDVVASEIKQLGGSLDIDSRLGEGTTFTVRLPFTVSVNRALMVSTGEDFYAIPLNTIEGIVRVSTWELEEYYQPEAPMYEYAGQEYRLQYLGGLLHSEHRPKLQGQALPLPVILVRGSEQPMALQVDSLLGSREIVVKSLGPQFSSVRGVSGATILGDGNVVVILDLPAMIRSDILSERQRLADHAAQQQQYREDRPTLVMVVDDSVTVRKVTSRLLERNGMEVVTAKDGLDAVAQLQDHRPDIILLDIEMPRMDGFEVASFVRHDDSLREVPICMITSRTGAKHRDRALSLGVNEYLGKPFQESELLETIERLTGEKIGDGES